MSGWKVAELSGNNRARESARSTSNANWLGKQTNSQHQRKPESAGRMNKVQFLDKLAFLFEHHPYKTLYGGRDGVKSWSIAQALLLLGTGTIAGWPDPLRILCGTRNDGFYS